MLNTDEESISGESLVEAKTDKVENTMSESEVVPENKNSGKPLVEKMAMPQPKVEKKANNSSAGLLEDQRKIKGVLENSEKYPIMIPLEPGEKAGAIKDIWINGLHIPVPKGVMVRVPEEVFNVLANSLKLTSEAGAGFLISRDSKTEDALL